ncbi:unnamed protein product, partial [Brugia pahangi]|uniref:FtsH_ext domain-containing protein n=1 Tax=Brugia pahangi TaxID=6280 RepID=A0A0N4T4R6_BRUPA
MLRVGGFIDCYPGKRFLRSLFITQLRKPSISLKFTLIRSPSKKCRLKASSSILLPSYQLRPSFLMRFFSSSSALHAVGDKNDGRGKKESSKESDNKRLRKFFTGLLIGSVIATVITSALTGVWQTRYTNQLTMHDFLTYIVPLGQIEQIVITGNNVARIIMKPGPVQNLPFSE